MICVAKLGENSQKLGKSAYPFLYLILVVVAMVEMVEVAVEMKARMTEVELTQLEVVEEEKTKKEKVEVGWIRWL